MQPSVSYEIRIKNTTAVSPTAVSPVTSRPYRSYICATFSGVDEMVKTVSLRDANQNFSRYVREVARGEEIVITRRGQPVARLVPVRAGTRKLSAEQLAALEHTHARAARGWSGGGARFEREVAHER
ncbi:MAG: type II toxin-antitoxin system Phd/YefM family antitoxin [Pseudomonadota bacterium]